MKLPTDLDLPTDYPNIRYVGSFQELVTAPFADGVNAVCWLRQLPGDYAEVMQQLAEQLEAAEGITPLDLDTLETLELTPAGKIAVNVLLEDQRMLRELDLAPSLDWINGYLRDAAAGPISTDVISFHVDSSPVETYTYLCTYYGTSSEGLRNDEALRKVDMPETRQELWAAYLEDCICGQEEATEPGFVEFLNIHCYDLHYAAQSHAKPFRFGVGHLWRIAVEHPSSLVSPCIHRAPETAPGAPSRLLLIS